MNPFWCVPVVDCEHPSFTEMEVRSEPRRVRHSPQCAGGKRCRVQRAPSCRWFCWKGGRRTERPSRRFSRCPLTAPWATKGNRRRSPAPPPVLIHTHIFYQSQKCHRRLDGFLLCAAQHTPGAGQRLPRAAVCRGLRLHPGLPEDDGRLGDTGPPRRPLPGSGTPAAPQETAEALTDMLGDFWWGIEEPRRERRALIRPSG